MLALAFWPAIPEPPPVPVPDHFSMEHVEAVAMPHRRWHGFALQRFPATAC
ncbi:MAG: hypothetical protein R3B99_31165 [Polyangiales bacterium]